MHAENAQVWLNM